MLQFVRDIGQAFRCGHSPEDKQLNADIAILCDLFKKHFDCHAFPPKPFIQASDVKAMGGISISISFNPHILSEEAFKEKLEHVKEVVHTVLPGKFFDVLRGSESSFWASFTLQVDELSLLNKQLECQFQPRTAGLGK